MLLRALHLGYKFNQGCWSFRHQGCETLIVTHQSWLVILVKISHKMKDLDIKKVEKKDTNPRIILLGDS